MKKSSELTKIEELGQKNLELRKSDLKNLIELGYMALEDGEFKEAVYLFNNALTLNIECADAYLGKAMAKYKIHNITELENHIEKFVDDNNFKRAEKYILKFLNHDLYKVVASKPDVSSKEVVAQETSEDYAYCIDPDGSEANKANSVCEYKYSVGEYKADYSTNVLYDDQPFKIEKPEKIEERALSKNYAEYEQKFANDDKVLIGKIENIRKEIEEQEKNIKAVEEIKSQKEEELHKAISNPSIKRYEFLKSVRDRIKGFQNLMSMGGGYSALVTSEGKVSASVSDEFLAERIKLWNDIVAVSSGNSSTIGLKSDGTVAAAGLNIYGECDIESWNNIAAVSAGYNHTIGLKANGAVEAAGANGVGQCNVRTWRNIVAVSSGNSYTIGLKSDGTVVSTGLNDCRQCDVMHWKDIVAISAGNSRTVGLKADGTVVITGSTHYYEQDELKKWRDIVAISAGNYHTLGLKADGTVEAAGSNSDGQCNVQSWNDIVAVIAGNYCTLGLKADGTVLFTGKNNAAVRCF